MEVLFREGSLDDAGGNFRGILVAVGGTFGVPHMFETCFSVGAPHIQGTREFDNYSLPKGGACINGAALWPVLCNAGALSYLSIGVAASRHACNRVVFWHFGACLTKLQGLHFWG
jgi:hypothetical protein